MNSRFKRHELISDWKQERLLNSTVVIIGMGALGNEVSRLLAMSGIGKLIICDPDIIEESNLSRATLFRQKDIGTLKVDAAYAALKELYPDIMIIKRPSLLIHGVGLGELKKASLVIGCLDSRSARLQISGRCQLVQAKYLDGGTHPWGGEIRPYFDENGPCYGCSLRPTDRSIVDEPWSCIDHDNENWEGSAIPSTAIVGSWMGMIAVRFLMGLSCPAGTIRIDASRGTSKIINQKRDPECPMHIPIGDTIKIDVTYKDKLHDLKKALPSGNVPLAWSEVQTSLFCIKCPHHENKWGRPKSEICPECGNTLLPRTTLELDDIPESLTLEELGIAPVEILAVRTKDKLEWIELCESKHIG